MWTHSEKDIEDRKLYQRGLVKLEMLRRRADIEIGKIQEYNNMLSLQKPSLISERSDLITQALERSTINKDICLNALERGKKILQNLRVDKSTFDKNAFEEWLNTSLSLNTSDAKASLASIKQGVEKTGSEDKIDHTP